MLMYLFNSSIVTQDKVDRLVVVLNYNYLHISWLFITYITISFIFLIIFLNTDDQIWRLILFYSLTLYNTWSCT